MSVSCYFFVEVQDAEGKWHLAKRYTDETFDTFDDGIYSFESETEIDGKKYVVKREKWTGLQLRDELSWSRAWDRSNAISGLPSDVSKELADFIKVYNEKAISDRKKLYDNEHYTFDFAKQCSYMSINDLWDLCTKKEEQWKEGLLERIRNVQLEEINAKLDDIKNLIINKGVEVKHKAEDKEEEYYEDTLEYYLNEYLGDVIQLRVEVAALSEVAENFTGDKWLSPDKVRVIFYFN